MPDDDFTLHVLAPEAPPAQSDSFTAPEGDERLDLHSGGANLLDRLRGDRAVSGARFAESWSNTRRALALVMEDADAGAKAGLRLDELEVSLTVSGEGNIAFVAAKAEASIVLKFKRSDATDT